MTPILVLITALGAGLLDEDHGWSGGTIAEQMREDATIVPFGKGAIFIPAMTNPLDEPPVSVWQGGQKVAEGTTGKRILVLPGSYNVRMGSGTVEQRFSVQTTVRELNTSVVPASWCGLSVHVVDEKMNSLRGSYELIRVEDREYLGIGFGADEQAGEPVSTWILRPGLYKIVRVGETYRARRDFATVRLIEGQLTHFQLVLAEDTGEFAGGGEIPQEELFAFGRGALWTTLIFGGDLSMISRRGTATGVSEGETFEIRAFVDTKMSAEFFESPLILRLQIEEGWNKSPEFPWQTSQDRAQLDGLYVYRIRPWIGPYLRVGAETNLLEGWRHFGADDERSIQVFEPDGDLYRDRADVERILLRSPFGLTTLKEGAGLNVRVFKAVFGETNVRAGVGGRHRVTRRLLEQTSGVDGDLEYQLVGNNHQAGIEATLLSVLRITRWVVINLEADTLVPFVTVADVEQRDASFFDDIILELEASLAIKLTRFISVNYVLRYLRDRTLSEDDQLENDVRLRFSFEFF